MYECFVLRWKWKWIQTIRKVIRTVARNINEIWKDLFPIYYFNKTSSVYIAA